MLRSTLLLCAAALGLAACGSDDEEGNAAEAAANAANAANTAAGDAANAAANAADEASNAAGEAADSATDAAAKIKGKGPALRLAPRRRVAFQGCPRIVNVSKPGGCMVVQSGSERYEIDTARPRPVPGKVIISGSGIHNPGHKGICMVGKHLSEVQWRETKALCPRRGG